MSEPVIIQAFNEDGTLPSVALAQTEGVVNALIDAHESGAVADARAARDSAILAAGRAEDAEQGAGVARMGAESARDLTLDTRDEVLVLREHLGRKHPTSSLAFGPSETARSLNVLGARVEGVPAGTAYGIDHGWVARTTDGWATKTNGLSTASASGWTHGPVGRMVAWSDGSLCLITTTHVVTMESFTTPPVATLEAEHSFWNGFSASFWEGSGQRVVLVGEYDQGNLAAKKLWLSRDGGATFAHIKSTVAGGNTNNHWHATAYDPWSNAIWAASGDDQKPPRGLHYSLDWGVTWSSMTADETRHLQPTLIVPFPTRVQFGRDAGLIKPGLDEWARPVSGQPVGNQPLMLGRLEFAQHLSAANIYPDGSTWCRGRTDDEAYIAFPKRATDTSYLWATGDGGASWHLVHTSTEPIVLQSDGQRIIMADLTPPRAVRVAPLLDWEWTPA